MISTQKNFLFIHVPKTAGNSIQEILKKYSDDEIICTGLRQDGIERFGLRSPKYKIKKHSTISTYRKELEPELFHRLFKFSIVRNPWDRMISLYFSPHQGHIEWNRKRFIKKVRKALTLRDYIVASSSVTNLRTLILRRLNIGKLTRKFERKALYSDINFLLRYECIDEDFKKLCKILDLPYETLQFRNVSDRQHYSYYYDQELKEIVRDKFAEEITYMDYEFRKQ